jgi:hypothetical protein
VELVSRPTASPPLGSNILLPSLAKARIAPKNCHAREKFLYPSSHKEAQKSQMKTNALSHGDEVFGHCVPFCGSTWIFQERASEPSQALSTMV